MRKRLLNGLLRVAFILTICLVIAPEFTASAQDGASQPAKAPDFQAAARRVLVQDVSGTPLAGNRLCLEFSRMAREESVKVLEELYDRTGLFLADNKKVYIVFAKNNSMYADTNAWRDGARMVVFVNADRPAGLRSLYQHEMVHALMTSRMRDNGRDYPLWIHEGLAMYASGQGADWTYGNRNSDPAKLIHGLLEERGFSDYIQYYLAFLFIEKTWGKDAIKKFATDVTFKATPWKNALQNATGLDWDTFEKRRQQFSLDHLAALRSPRK